MAGVVVIAVISVGLVASVVLGAGGRERRPTPASTSAGDHRVAAGFSLGELVGDSPDASSSLLDLAQQAGADVVRFDVSWDTVQPRDAEHHDWAPVDAAFAAVHDRGLSVLPVIGYTPGWARGPGCSSINCPPRDPAAFASFAGAVAARYASDDVHAWEIWNEPNTAWAPAPDPVAYAQLLRLTAQAVRHQVPGAAVLVGGLAPATTSHGGSMAPATFLSAVYRAAGRSAFDGVAMHAYCVPALPGEEHPWSGWTQMVATRAVMVSHKDSAKGIWITEFGASTSGDAAVATLDQRREDQHPDHVDQQMQALTVTDAFGQAAKAPWLRSLIWYSLIDLSDAVGPANLRGYGLVTDAGTPKPSFVAWQRAVAPIISPAPGGRNSASDRSDAEFRPPGRRRVS